MKQIGRYTIKRELGRGGMATVYLAEDPRFGREVAVKTLPHNFLHDPQFRARFDQEARAIARLEHPAIVPVYDVGEQDEQPYLVMRYMAGGSLSEKLRQKGAFRLDDALPIIQRIAAALDRAHRSGIIHRDLKPGNILFDDDNNAYLGDFGIAYLAEASMAFTGSSIIGTPTYMSPEQARGDKKMDGRSDIYSLGVLLYEMLTGQPPYRADTAVGIAMRHINDPIPAVTDTNVTQPSAVNLIVAKAMAKDREQRYQTGAEFARVLGNVGYGRAPAAPATAILDNSDMVDDGVTVPIQSRAARSKPVQSTARQIHPAKSGRKAAVSASKGAGGGGIPGWLYPALGVGVLLFAFLAGGFFTLRTRTNNIEATPVLVRPNTPTVSALAALDGTEPPEPIETEVETETPTSTASPSVTATATATETSEPTETGTPESTETSEPTNTNTPRPTSTNTRRPTSTSTPRPIATNTLPPPTSVPVTVAPIVVAPTVRPTNTPIPSTNTPIPSTNTPIPSTNTPIPSTNTPIPSTNTPIPSTNTPIPPTDVPIPSAAIITFTTSRASATVGDEIVVAWQVDGAPGIVSLSQFINSNPRAVFDEAVTAVGQRTFNVTNTEMNGREIVFQLEVEGVEISDTVRVALTCDHEFFFTAPNILPNNLCPNAPVITNMGEHRFSGGTLYWLEAFDQIYVHLFNGTSRKVSDDWRLDLPEDVCPEITTANPAFKPTRGFGVVWCNNAEIRAALGEPIAGPSGFPSVSQKARPNGTIEWIKVRAGHVLEIPANSGTWTERPNVTAD